jgi:hypothetical protein
MLSEPVSGPQVAAPPMTSSPSSLPADRWDQEAEKEEEEEKVMERPPNKYEIKKSSKKMQGPRFGPYPTRTVKGGYWLNSNCNLQAI